MKRLLLVDDEFIFRQGLKYILAWEEFGYEIAAEASNGQEALALLEQTPFDLVLCDVVMPGMDGVAFMRHLSQRADAPPVIMLSNYDEYEKVRRAFKHGAKDYLLKNKLTKESLLRVAERFCEPEPPGPHESATGFAGLAREVFDGYVQPPYTALQGYVESRAPHPCYNILYLDTPRADLAGEEELRELFERLLPHTVVFAVFTSHNHGIVLVCSEHGLGKAEAAALFAAMQGPIRHCCCVLSHSFTDIRLFKETAERLLFVSKYSVFDRENLFFWEPDIVVREDAEEFGSELYMSFLKNSCWRDAKGLLLSYVEKISTEKSMNPYAFKKFLENMVYSTLFEARKLVHRPEELSRLELRLFKQLDQAYSFSQIVALLDSLFAVLEAEAIKNNEYGSLLVRQVLEFIEHNYQRPITLNDAAQALHINYSYLSGYISQNTSSHFSEHLNNIRVSHAKQLLATTDMSVNQISEMVGYSDQSYFGKVFKRLVGTTPLQYRTSAGKGELYAR